MRKAKKKEATPPVSVLGATPKSIYGFPRLATVTATVGHGALLSASREENEASLKAYQLKFADLLAFGHIEAPGIVGMLKAEATKGNLDAVDTLQCFAKASLSALCDLMDGGSMKAADAYIHELFTAVQKLNQPVKKRLPILRWLAQQQSAWPVMFHVHPEHREVVEDAVLNKLCLGARNGTNFSAPKGKLASPSTQAVDIALGLRDRIISYAGPNQSGEIADNARKLPPLNRATAHQWWRVGNLIFMRDYPDFENHPAFATFWKSSAYSGMPRHEARVKIRSAIKATIAKAFKNMASR